MSSLKEYFHTDWQAMTGTDWVGTILTVVIFLLMVGLYFYVLRPKNRDKFEPNKYIPVDDEQIRSGEKNGG
ncbi:MAG: cbb3-type cytochrome c oxidase subunit 3 [Chromatiaceae bacterium]|nr:cbb3-type cytochrome c oxidase subunit 3 [Gammaproteobacteria bacterium]MCB1862276.1 cbb3-type cytochrome c oxidase subunit 3 [Gammaproteobacteria bacterium]MCB1878522.1 cbb3-type cytochrome c oxidase subunit 3 [Gammaproteobacteria bacterium]MCP5448173.1 cbb3-type cytochrome c oxidase subunit 3 [Chromatiaceae bacterium]